MHVKNLFEVLYFSLFISFSLAARQSLEGDCEKIEKYLEEKEYNFKPIHKCVVDKDGHLIELNFSNSYLHKEDVKEILSYNTIEKLTIHEGYNIKTIPEEIFNLKNLKELDLSYNGIEKIPKELSNLKKLEHLDLHANHIDSEIPESLNTLPNLKFIDFSHNKNLKGKTLINDSLESCNYLNEEDEGLSLCMTKKMDCFSSNQSITPCDNSITIKKNSKVSTTTTTTTKKLLIKKSLETSISTTGKCGGRDGRCPDGECCSKYGYCGKSDKHCGTGCQREFGHCNSSPTDLKITTNDKCNATDGRCPDGECCSKYGYCGKSDKHCGTGCQPEFGQCNSSPSDLKITTNDKCNATDGRCPDGECCSKYGHCGKSDKHCGTGCQPEFGQCNSSPSDLKITTNGKCNATDGRCPDGECCSKYGYCGKSDKYCGTGCQPEFGQCNSPTHTTSTTTIRTCKSYTFASSRCTRSGGRISTTTKSGCPSPTCVITNSCVSQTFDYNGCIKKGGKVITLTRNSCNNYICSEPTKTTPCPKYTYVACRSGFEKFSMTTKSGCPSPTCVITKSNSCVTQTFDYDGCIKKGGKVITNTRSGCNNYTCSEPTKTTPCLKYTVTCRSGIGKISMTTKNGCPSPTCVITKSNSCVTQTFDYDGCIKKGGKVITNTRSGCNNYTCSEPTKTTPCLKYTVTCRSGIGKISMTTKNGCPSPTCVRDTKKEKRSCWAERYGYPCCTYDNINVVYEDEDGQWGLTENNEWCGIQI